MLKYILKRMLQMIPTVFGVILLTFILFNVVPNDLAALSLGKNVTHEALENFDEVRGFNKPLFFGFRCVTRAYSDHNFSDGPGIWNGLANAAYSIDTKTVSVSSNAIVQPVAFELKADTEYEWKIRFRGTGSVAGETLSSATWKTAKVRFAGSTDPGIKAGDEPLEIASIKLRRVVTNPFDSQLLFYLKQLAHGELGRSESFKLPVADLLLDGIPISLKLTVPIFFIGMIISIVFSLVCAFFRDTWLDRSLVVFSVALMSINYLVYIVAGQYILAYRQGWFPVWGYESWRYFVLPVTIGVISGLGANIRFYRTIMLDEMYKDYVRTAFAKGVSKPRVLFLHVLKNAMIPIITNVVIAIPYLYTGSLLLEKFFGIPGLGYLGVTSILASDVDVVRALVLIGALLFVVCNLLADLCYAVVDPRVKLK